VTATRRAAVTVVIAVLASFGSSSACHAQDADSIAYRPLADRVALESAVVALEPAAARERRAREAVAYARARLEHGDFRPGDLIFLELTGDPALVDTLVVGPDTTLLVPPPVARALALRGVLRAELPDLLGAFVARFVREPTVVARPLLRVALDGEVERAGFYAIPADARLSDALMAGGGVTARGDLTRLRVTRNGRTVIDRQAMRRALSLGLSLDEVLVRDGDVISVGRDGAAWEERLRFTWLIVSLTGGLYGLWQIL
jgi:protein involved in polysaccharide export with SLBB domain